MAYLQTGLAALIFTGFIILSIIFLSEGSGKASIRALMLAVILSLPFFIFIFSTNNFVSIVGEIVTFVTIVLVIVLLLPVKGKNLQYSFNSNSVVDERDIMFSRKDLKPETDIYNDYYSRNPEKEIKDKIWRSEPGLLSTGSAFYNKLAFAAADASFKSVRLFTPLRDLQPEMPPAELSGTDITSFIRLWAKKLGAVDVGFLEMKDNHYYTSSGRGSRYGNPVSRDHQYGIVFLVEMDEEMVAAGPRAPVVMESANQYMRSAAIATQVAIMIRKLGFRALTHIDGNYDVICPVVARDAGLGEIGRHGLLISHKYGARVRISVVTTDIPLHSDKLKEDRSILNFCSVCRKCAVNCPAKSIPEGDMEKINGNIKWQMNQESCFTYWNHAGTDCGRCMSTCPYSHRNNWFHRIVRSGIRNNIFFLHLAVFLDDFFYGKRPSSLRIPDLLS